MTVLFNPHFSYSEKCILILHSCEMILSYLFRPAICVAWLAVRILLKYQKCVITRKLTTSNLKVSISAIYSAWPSNLQYISVYLNIVEYCVINRG